jgi:hypothetical protein
MEKDLYPQKNNFAELLEKRRIEYKTWIPVYSFVLQKEITFNSDGFNHLRFNVDGTPRNPREQMYKLGLLPLVIPTIKKATGIKKYTRLFAPIGRKKKKGAKIMKELEYWALESVVGQQNVKIRVIIRKIGTGNIHFWSVMKIGEKKSKNPTE